MKKLVLLLAAVLFAIPAFAGTGGYMHTDVQDAALTHIATNGTVWSFVTDISGPITYTQADTATGSSGRSVAKVTVTAGAGNGVAGSGGYGALGAGAVSGRALSMLGITGMTNANSKLIGNGTATHICILYPAQSKVLACNPLAQNKTIAAYTTETWDWSALDQAIEFRAYVTSQ